MELTIDCRNGMSAIHAQLAEALSFPSWYGSNLDALHDQLTSLSGTIRLENWEVVEERLGKYGLSAKRAILHAALENEQLIVIL